MRARSIILPFLTSALTLSLLVFVACAHKGPESDDPLLSESSEGPQEIYEAAPDQSSEGDSANTTASTEPDSESAAPLEDLLENPETEQQAVTDASPESSPSLDAAVTDATAPSDGLDQAPLESAKTEAIITDESSNTAVMQDTLTEIENPGAAPVDSTDPVPTTASVIPQNTQWSAGSRLPKIPKMALKRGGTSLNRFYFYRVTDTAEVVAARLMGSAEKLAQLRKFNSGKWRPGQPLFYPSVSDPSDRKMQSFYEERNIRGESYTVGKGDWLSKIAARNFGSPMSWKEIAILNGIHNPDTIERGQRIVLMPKDLSDYSQASQYAERRDVPAESARPAVVASNGVQQAPLVLDEPEQPPQPESVIENVPPPSVPPPPGAEQKAQHSFDLENLIEQNLLFIAIGAAIALLLIALLAIKKKKSRVASEDFGDDPVAPPKARKR